MTRSKSILNVATIVVVMLAWCVVGCSDFDDSYGSDYVPSSQNLTYKMFDSDTCKSYNFFSTSLFLSDSIRSSNIGLATYGVEQRDGFGERRAGFFSQFITLDELNEDDDDDWDEDWPFGYEPIFDSLMLYFTLMQYSGDTTFCQQFEVYEAMDVDFLNYTMDSVYFNNFDINQLNLTEKPLFTFTFPDQENYVYMDDTSVRLYPNPDNADEVNSFIDRLLLRDDNANNDIYDFDEREQFLETFKGLYIKPVSQIDDSYETVADWNEKVDSKGATYSIYTDGSGLGLYARSRYESDPTIIKDTVTIAYGFRSFSTSDDDYYGVTINTVERSGGVYGTDIDSSVEVSTIMIEGMGGVASKITLTEDLFAMIEAEMNSTVDDKGAYDYRSIFVNQARLTIYAPTDYVTSYDPEKINPINIVDWFDSVLARLGMYTNYTDYYLTEDDYDDDDSTLEGITDYYYEYELLYSTYLPYGGFLSRTFGAYEMIISAQIQDAWNSYLEAKEDAGGDVSKINWDDVEDRSFVIAPVADALFTARYVTLQGMDEGTNTAPMRLRLTYTLIK